MSNDSVTPVRVRFAPSPTGSLHIAGARTALYNYLLAKSRGGEFILRIEDTDRKRYVEGAEQELMDSLRWLGVQWDEGPDVGGPYGPYRQSERKEIYAEHARKLIATGHAYYCFCTPERLERVHQEQQKNKQAPRYDRLCRSLSLEEAQARVDAGEKHVVRFKMPLEGSTTAVDLLRGPVTFENSALDDFILVKSDGWALYHLAATVDDHLMKVTHVLRGSEWLPTFPLHALIHRALGGPEPVWVHLSVFLKPSGKGKMSKRDSQEIMKDGYSINVRDFPQLGYLPEGLANWIALMGWSYDDRTEFFNIQDLVEKFTLEKLNPAPAAINFTKLDHFNGLHIRSLSVDDLAERLLPYFTAAGLAADKPALVKITPIIQERMTTLDEAVDLAGFFFRDEVSPNAEELVAKDLTAAQSLEVARLSLAALEPLPEMKLDEAEPVMRELVERLGYKPGQVFGILRVAVTGQRVSPPLFESMEIIGKEIVIGRIRAAIALLETLN